MQPGSQAMAGGSPGFLARAYFRLKPVIPKSLRWAIRRIRIPRILRRSDGVWPIDESAGSKPGGWQGWPEGKQFALVLTHDVESKEGVERAGKVAGIEMNYGLRSSFNFIPEGPYEDPVELRHWLEEEGFEIGVHDLYHDGHLYESRAGFREKAEIINRYLKKWNAVGFRSGFMLRQLDWIHDLDVLYDTSTFDTDPFEAQPDGSQTIFPFHVPAPAGSGGAGYVELSYTLPQDSTLFILLREKTPFIWKQKLDWIAENGGMALVNIHPDYIEFSEDDNSKLSYRQDLLVGFLDYIRTNYDGVYWNPLPKDLAHWYKTRKIPGNETATPVNPQS